MKPPAYATGSEVEHFEKFCRDHLVQSVDRWNGEPLELYPAQREFFNEALAFDEHGLPIWQSVVQVVSRKNGKTTAQAGYALYRLLTDDWSPEILLAAASDRQAGRAVRRLRGVRAPLSHSGAAAEGEGLRERDRPRGRPRAHPAHVVRPGKAVRLLAVAGGGR